MEDRKIDGDEVLEQIQQFEGHVEYVTYQVVGCDSITVPIHKIWQIIYDIEEEFEIENLSIEDAISSKYLDYVEFIESYNFD